MEVDELPSEVEANYVQTWLQQMFLVGMIR